VGIASRIWASVPRSRARATARRSRRRAKRGRPALKTVMDDRQRFCEVPRPGRSSGWRLLAPLAVDGSPRSEQGIIQADVVPDPLPYAAHRQPWVDALPEDERVEEVQAGPWVVGVPFEDEVVTVVVASHVVGARRRRGGHDALGDGRDSGWTMQKKGRDSRSRKSGDGLVSSIVSRSPAARTPEMCAALPSRNACSPAMSAITCGPGEFDPSLGDSARSIE
jgi:hypothetical protein